jgi:hypothetical protein
MRICLLLLLTAACAQLITRNGKTLSKRVWALIADTEKELGMQLRVVQGSFNKGGVALSAGTHDGGGAVDFSVSGMSEATAIKIVVALRKRNGAAWLRTPKYGWPSRLSRPHIHMIVKDEPHLSSGARQQVSEYNIGQNGLASHARDPFPRPPQHPFNMDEPEQAKPAAKHPFNMDEPAAKPAADPANPTAEVVKCTVGHSNIRSSPGLHGEIVATADAGDVWVVSGTAVQKNRFTWRRVSQCGGGVSGYMAMRHDLQYDCTCEASANTVPRSGTRAAPAPKGPAAPASGDQRWDDIVPRIASFDQENPFSL